MEARVSDSSENDRRAAGERLRGAPPRRCDSVYSSTGGSEGVVCFRRAVPVDAIEAGVRAAVRAADVVASRVPEPVVVPPPLVPVSVPPPVPPLVPMPARIAAIPLGSMPAPPPVLIEPSLPRAPTIAPVPPVPPGSTSPCTAIMPATRLAIVPLCAGDCVQALALAIAVASRLAALTMRPGAVVTADPSVLRLVRNSRRRPRGVRLDGFKVLARRGNILLIGADDAGAAAIAISAQLPLVSLVAADERMDGALAEIRPGALLLVAGVQTGARYLELAERDLAARLPAARVLSAGFGVRDGGENDGGERNGGDRNGGENDGRDRDDGENERGENERGEHERNEHERGVPSELALFADQSASLRLRLGLRASRATRVNAQLLAAQVLEGRR